MDTFYLDKAIHAIRRGVGDLKSKIYQEVAKLEVTYHKTKEPVPYSERLSGTYVPIKEGEKWGQLWDCAWFRLQGVVPEGYEYGSSAPVLQINVSGEGLIYDNTGVPIRGITSVGDLGAFNGWPIKRNFVLDGYGAGDKINFYMDVGCNDLFGNYQDGTLKQAAISVCNPMLREVFYDFLTLTHLAETLDKKSARYKSLIHALYDAVCCFCEYTDTECAAAKKILNKELNKKGGAPSLNITALGHAHLDLAWLWPIRETKRKALRTTSTALKMFEKYPDYIFTLSQPQQVEWIKELSPELYGKIKEAVKKGKIEPVGGMWTEPDLNVTGGESLVRQLMYGKRFWKDEMGVNVDNAWIPDVFGFNAALPQLLKKSGIDYLLTIKMSWNNYTRFPYHSFIWKGIDGSEILTHMPPEGNYNSDATPGAVKKTENEYIEAGKSENAMMLFGIGDGGGGPGTSHLEFLKRQKNLDGLSPVTQRTAKEFFKLLDKEKAKLPIFKGEMYLERHQGTYTTQGRNKRFNRRLEVLLKNAEFLALKVQDKIPYPAGEFQKIWKEVLLYQFHDILPGSSIKRVYDESVERYAILEKQAQGIIDRSIAAMSGGEDAVYNLTGFEREEIVKVKNNYYKAKTEPFAPCLIADAIKVTSSAIVKATKNTLENDIITAMFDNGGRLTGVRAKDNKREYLYFGNELIVYNDDGDCWDIADNYLDRPKTVLVGELIESVSDGVVAKRAYNYRYGKSIITQVITLKQGESFLRFDCSVDWKESSKMLRCDFAPTAKTERATYDIQFGRVTRPVTTNNLAEFAQNEVCAQKWADYSQPDFGVSIINDCKYGYRVKDGVVSINLLRSPDSPGKDSDKAEHSFSYLLYAHESQNDVDRIAHLLINPLVFCKVEKESAFVKCTEGSVIIECVKKCEYDQSPIVRLYESEGKNALVNLTAKGYNTYKETNLLETNDLEEQSLSASLKFAPFEIKTIKLLKN